MVRLADRPDMTTAVTVDFKQQYNTNTSKLQFYHNLHWTEYLAVSPSADSNVSDSRTRDPVFDIGSVT